MTAGVARKFGIYRRGYPSSIKEGVQHVFLLLHLVNVVFGYFT
ncbi:hypothetical protein OH492_16455 [Vibrio chagasii]|nr:hypothetical protein [Vibrio chagasii]